MGSNFLNDQQWIKELEKEYQRKLNATMGRIERRIKVRMEEIKQKMLFEYYGGYTPKIYVRIDQLRLAFGPKTKHGIDGDFITLTFGLSDLEDDGFGAQRMDHSVLTMHIRYQRKKKGGIFEKDYVYANEGADEEKIFNSFKAGYHPMVGHAETKPDIWGRASKMIDDFIENELDDIIAEEISRMK